MATAKQGVYTNIDAFNLIAELYRRHRRCIAAESPDILYTDKVVESLMRKPRVRVLKSELLHLLSEHGGKLFAPAFAPALRQWAEVKMAENDGFTEGQKAIVLAKLLDRFPSTDPKKTADTVYRDLWKSGSVPKVFTSLNSNAEETGFWVIPYLGSYLQRKDSMNLQRPHFDHFSVIEIETFRLQNVAFSICNYMDAKTFIETKKPLRIALCPVTRENVLKWDPTITDDNIPGFLITGLKNEDRIGAIVEEAIRAAAKERADILLFPEMLGSEEFRRLPVFHDESFMNCPGLICMPTIWKDHRNVAEIPGCDGDPILRQDKQFGFYWTSEDRLEDLREQERTICIFHKNHIGRVVVSICVDFLTPGLSELLIQNLEPTIYLIPSWTGGTTPFLNGVGRSAACGGITIWLNSCAALDKPDENTEIACIYQPPYHAVSGESDRYGFTTCTDEHCGGCVMFADITYTGSSDTKWTLKKGFDPERVSLNIYEEGHAYDNG